MSPGIAEPAAGPAGERLGLYGGSFDPIHQGHVLPVLHALSTLGLDRVLYLPTARPPHKRGHRLAPALRRFAMVELALLAEPRLEVSPYEVEKQGPAYTVETLEHFARERPEAELFLLIGADSFATLPTWYRFEELAERADLVVMTRPGTTCLEDAEAWHPSLRRARAAGRIHLVENRSVAASSTELRRLLAAGADPPVGWMQAAVLDYVHKYRLYREAPPSNRSQR
ncbi:MAG: nicotinate-nucleotide adenylyltransferase [Holophagales bacterium]|nr:nicotinate-nucleotide adenylyltransferase [Holophagales bacterium]